MSNERNWSVFLRRLFLFCFCLSFVFFFYVFAIVSFITTTPAKFQFQSQVRLSQINVLVPIHLKLKLYAVFIKWGWRKDFLFKGRQDIINYWDFPSKISRNRQKKFVPNYSTWITKNVWKNVFSRPTGLFCRFCWNESACPPYTCGSLLFLLPIPKCFLRVCLPTFFAAVSKFYYH